jgi:hypothetical protein
VGISSQSITDIENFIEDQGITFPVLRDTENVRSLYNIPGSQSPYPRDFVIDQYGIVRLAKTEYDPNSILHTLEIIMDGENGIDDSAIPKIFELLPPYPNPFNPTTNIQFNLDATVKNVSLNIYDLNARWVETVMQGTITAGTHNINWNGTHHPSGIYFIHLTDGFVSQSQKLILLK